MNGGAVLASCLAALALGCGQAPAPPFYLPTEVASGSGSGYVSSRACRSCHPGQYDSWHRSYHRTMTQPASLQTVAAPWTGELRVRGRTYRFLRRGDELRVDMPRQGTPGIRPNDRVELPVVLTTGSHHLQYYWMPAPWAGPEVAVAGAPLFERRCGSCHGSSGEGNQPPDSAPGLRAALLSPAQLDSALEEPPHVKALSGLGEGQRRRLLDYVERLQFPGRLVPLPLVYFLRDRVWLEDGATFLQPEDPLQTREPYGKHWNANCDGCHTTAPSYRWDEVDRLGQTELVELGIACEACHGPGRLHVERQRNPARRYLEHAGLRSADDIVNPSRLDAARSASICAQCHSASYRKSGDPVSAFTPGERIEESLNVLRRTQAPYPEWLSAELELEPDLFRNSFWDDGTIRIAGRDFNGLVESACYQKGGLACITCHSLHESDPDDQLKREAVDDRVCSSCHQDIGRDATVHTHHPNVSPGSRCMNCHMPHTTWGLLGAIRAHRVDSPDARRSFETGRPDACSSCHLDRTLGWTAEWLSKWYGTAPVALPDRERTAAASILWLVRGDAVQRAVIAWHMGWEPALAASGKDWQAPYLVLALDDPYAAVRYSAYRSLTRLRGFEDFAYDFQAPRLQRRRSMVLAERRLARLRPAMGDRPELLMKAGKLLREAVDALVRARDDRVVIVAE